MNTAVTIYLVIGLANAYWSVYVASKTLLPDHARQHPVIYSTVLVVFAILLWPLSLARLVKNWLSAAT